MTLKSVHTIRSTRFLAAALVAVLIAACSDSDLLKVSHALEDTALAVATIQDTTFAANQAKLMSDDEVRSVLAFTRKVNKAGQEASAITRRLNSLTPADRTNLTAILEPLSQALLEANGPVAGIKDESKRLAIQAAIAIISTALTSARFALGGR